MIENWSIGILAGSSPLTLRPASEVGGPVLRGSDVRDMAADFVADPFMLRVGETWTMLFELLERATGFGRIGAATSSDALRWRYHGVVLSEPFHLSYPHVFEWRGDIYMTPETLAPDVVRLYRAEAFPDRWRHVADLVEGPAADPTPFRHADRWWLFTCAHPYQNDMLRLYSADDLLGPWHEHPASPVVRGDRQLGRPGGRVIELEGRLLRFAQDCRRSYGEGVAAVEIVTLTRDDYRERLLEPAPLLGPGSAWWPAGMHHVDAHALPDGRWIACVDGRG